MKQNKRRDEGKEGRQTEQGGLRKQLVRMIQRRVWEERRRDTKKERNKRERRWKPKKREVQEIDEGE